MSQSNLILPDEDLFITKEAAAAGVQVLDELIISLFEQGSPEWHADRAGHITGSRFYDVITRSKRDNKYLKGRETYMWAVATERINQRALDEVNAKSLQWGKDNEPFARDAYELHVGEDVEQCGFIKRTILPWVGVSVDGLVGEDGSYESKCPKDSTVHMQTWYNGMPEEHYPQVQGGLWVTGRSWCDFVSFDPRARKELRLYVERVYRDEEFITTLEQEVKLFNEGVEAIIAVLKKKGGIQ